MLRRLDGEVRASRACSGRRCGMYAYFATGGRPENQPFAQLLLEHGLQQPDGIDTDLGTSIGNLRQNPGRPR
jgi:hypothetical protein